MLKVHHLFIGGKIYVKPSRALRVRISPRHMQPIQQLSMFPEPDVDLPVTATAQPLGTDLLAADLGTFKDSLRAPIFGWFQYPAGYSYKLVDALFDHYGVRPGADQVSRPIHSTRTRFATACPVPGN
jgi:hypothetical protein